MADTGFTLNWKKLDPEARIGLPAKKFTGVAGGSGFLLAIVLTVAFYGVLFPFWQMKSYQFINMFFHGGEENRSFIPYVTVFLSMWCLALLWIKSKKIKVQRRALELQILPETAGFILSPDNSAVVLNNIDGQVYTANNFMVLNRIQKTLANLKNIGRVSDVSSVLNDCAIADEKYIESTYTFTKGLIWAIPVTGFIGTVLGLSEAVGGFGKVITEGADLSVLKASLSGVTGGLAVAFETTLIALVAALLLQLLMTLIMQKEEDFMDDCANFCYQNIIARLKMIDTGD
ncbi:MAG: MotA/TolQ/ExbB proton channel family protein [Lentisphaerae bacterium]|nr:MotA/TolQ/ExbB proton channel family protein [Lentisphaerota bacterium]